VAGDRRGRDDERFLWPEFSRLVRDLGPHWVVAENVPGILSLAADDICADLESAGYEVGIWDFEAAAVGAPHRRERVFFVAHAGRGMCERGAVQRAIRGKSKDGAAISIERSGSTYVPDTDGELTQRFWADGQHGSELFDMGGKDTPAYVSNTAGAGCETQGGPIADETKHDPPRRDSGGRAQSRVGRAFDGLFPWMDGSWDRVVPRTARGVPNRAARLRALGNAVVPQQAYPIFRAIYDEILKGGGECAKP